VQRPLLITVLAAFSLLTAVAVWHDGVVGIFTGQLQSWGGRQVLVDLVIALGLVLVWLWRDARSIGRNPWPWIVLTLAAGSFGPLIYLLTRPAPGPRP
jgi:hypothetical protein